MITCQNLFVISCLCDFSTHRFFFQFFLSPLQLRDTNLSHCALFYCCKGRYFSWGRIKHLNLQVFFPTPSCLNRNGIFLLNVFFGFFLKGSSFHFLNNIFLSPITDRNCDLINSSLVYHQVIEIFTCCHVKIFLWQSVLKRRPSHSWAFEQVWEYNSIYFLKYSKSKNEHLRVVIKVPR